MVLPAVSHGGPPFLSSVGSRKSSPVMLVNRPVSLNPDLNQVGVGPLLSPASESLPRSGNRGFVPLPVHHPPRGWTTPVGRKGTARPSPGFTLSDPLLRFFLVPILREV